MPASSPRRLCSSSCATHDTDHGSLVYRRPLPLPQERRPFSWTLPVFTRLPMTPRRPIAARSSKRTLGANNQWSLLFEEEAAMTLFHGKIRLFFSRVSCTRLRWCADFKNVMHCGWLEGDVIYDCVSRDDGRFSTAPLTKENKDASIRHRCLACGGRDRIKRMCAELNALHFLCYGVMGSRGIGRRLLVPRNGGFSLSNLTLGAFVFQ